MTLAARNEINRGLYSYLRETESVVQQYFLVSVEGNGKKCLNGEVVHLGRGDNMHASEFTWSPQLTYYPIDELC
jgi:hypothetical protein